MGNSCVKSTDISLVQHDTRIREHRSFCNQIDHHDPLQFSDSDDEKSPERDKFADDSSLSSDSDDYYLEM